MSLRNVFRAGVKIADKITKPLQADVQFRHCTSTGGTGERYYDPPNDGTAPVLLKALVDWKQRSLRTAEGDLSVSRSSVQFLDVAALFDATNGEGINDNDLIILPDGTTGPILDMGGFVDAGTGHPFATEVFLG